MEKGVEELEGEEAYLSEIAFLSGQDQDQDQDQAHKTVVSRPFSEEVPIDPIPDHLLTHWRGNEAYAHGLWAGVSPEERLNVNQQMAEVAMKCRSKTKGRLFQQAYIHGKARLNLRSRHALQLKQLEMAQDAELRRLLHEQEHDASLLESEVGAEVEEEIVNVVYRIQP